MLIKVAWLMRRDVYVLPDPQVKPKTKHALAIVAHDIVESKPSDVVCLGDLFDMPSLSAYDKGKISFHSRRYIDDIDAGNLALYEFWSIIEAGRAEDPKWKCKFYFCKGNHEDRIRKAMEFAPTELSGLLELYQPDYSGWDKVAEFLEPVLIGGVCFTHYLANEFSGRAISTASAGLKAKHSSFVCGHKQVLDYAEAQTIGGKRIMGLQIGACYYHDEGYKGPQNNRHFRGTALLRNLEKGQWEMEIRNLSTLTEKYK